MTLLPLYLFLVSSDIGGAEQRLVYTLQATIPSELLAACSAALPRPSWEPLLYYTVLTLLAIMLGATLLIAMMDADILIKDNVNAVTAHQVPLHLDREHVFDLRAIALREPNNKKPITTINHNAFVNGHTSMDLPHLRNTINTKVNYNTSISNSNNCNNKKGVFNTSNHTSSNGTLLLNTKAKTSKSNEENPSEGVHNFIINTSGHNSVISASHIAGGAMAYAWQCGSFLWRLVSRSIPRDTTRRKKHSSSSSCTSGKTKTHSSCYPSKINATRDSSENSTSANTHHKDNSNTKSESPTYAVSQPAVDSKAEKFNKYNSSNGNNKASRFENEFKTKDKMPRHNNMERGNTKELAGYTAEEYCAEHYSALSYKPSQKIADHEEETSSCTTESSNTEDVSASDKVSHTHLIIGLLISLSKCIFIWI